MLFCNFRTQAMVEIETPRISGIGVPGKMGAIVVR
jgi:hypothetical protein